MMMSLLKTILYLPIELYYKIIEIIYCNNKGHKFDIIKDIEFKNSKYKGVKIIVCKHCKKTKMMWYI